MSGKNGNGIPADFQGAGRALNRLVDPPNGHHSKIPRSIEAEQGVLGCIMLSAQCIDQCEERFKGDGENIFYDLRHSALYSICQELYCKTRILDEIAVVDELRRRNQLDSVGGISYVCSLADTVPSAANLSYYLDIVMELYVLRRMISLLTEYIGRAHEFIPDIEIFLDEFERDLLMFSSLRNNNNGSGKVSQYLVEHQGRLEEGWRMGATGLSTGFRELDEILGGLGGGQLIVLGASPSVGKTALALNIACHQVRRKIPCAFFSLEMTGEEIAARMASEQSGIPLKSASKGLDEEDNGRYGTAMKQVNGWPLWICDESGMTVSQIRSRARRFKAEHKIQFLVVDYIGLVESGVRTDTRNDAVAYVSRNFKAMAKELNIPVLILAQLSREHKKAQRRPTLHDLRESGAIEADADKIMMLFPKKADGNMVEVLVEKNRNGARGRIELEFDAPIFRFQQIKEEIPCPI